MAVELTIPTAGESITEVQIGTWLKDEGDFVRADELVVEIETDKASMELPAPASGVLSKQLKAAGEIVPVGAVIGLIEESDEPADAGAAKQPAESAAEKQQKSDKPPQAAARGANSDAGRKPGGTATAESPRVMPAARRAAADADIDPTAVKPSGPGGRVLKEDVQRHLADREASGPQPTPSGPATGDGDRQEEVVPMTMLRRRIAQRLVEAKQTQAQLTTFNEVDLSAVLSLRKTHNEAFQKRYGIKLGIMSFFVKAAIDALKMMPAVNGEIRGDSIVYKDYYDIGVAVSTEQGLVVPVIRDADRLSFAEVEQRIADLATRARDRKITVEELQGGTFTITNGGVFGSLLATPIINYPQSAILGMHTIQERPVAIDGQVVIRPMMYIALTYDHRIIDGRESVTFLKRIKECVENPARMLVEV